MKSLKAIRISKGLTQREVAKSARLSQPTYSNIENEERRPSVSTAKRIAAVLGFDWTRFYEEGDGQDSA